MSLSEREKMVRGKPYKAFGPELVAERLRAETLCHRYNQSAPDDLGLRQSLLNELLGSMGKNAVIMPTFRCDYGWNIHVGDNFYANYDLIVLDVCEVRIGKNCMIAPRVVISTAGHPLDRRERCEEGLEFGQPITIGDDVWLGAGAIINPGVTIGDNVVIGAGAVVTRDIPSNSVAVGVPAKVSRSLESV